MKNALVLALTLAAALPAAAQNRAAEIDWENARHEAEEAAKAREKLRADTISSAMTAMNDGVTAGGAIVARVEEQSIVIRVDPLDAPSSLTHEKNRPVITLSASLPASVRLYAALIAKETAKTMFDDMGAVAEREYMRQAMIGRVFVELGGETSTVPAQLAGDVKEWLISDRQMALSKVAEKTKLPIIPELYTGKAAADAKLDAANKKFTAFLLDETPTRNSVGLR